VAAQSINELSVQPAAAPWQPVCKRCACPPTTVLLLPSNSTSTCSGVACVATECRAAAAAAAWSFVPCPPPARAQMDNCGPYIDTISCTRFEMKLGLTRNTQGTHSGHPCTRAGYSTPVQYWAARRLHCGQQGTRGAEGGSTRRAWGEGAGDKRRWEEEGSGRLCVGCFRRFSRFVALAALATPMAGSRVPLRAARPKPVGRALLTPSRGVGSMALRLGAAREIWAIK